MDGSQGGERKTAVQYIAVKHSAALLHGASTKCTALHAFARITCTQQDKCTGYCVVSLTLALAVGVGWSWRVS